MWLDELWNLYLLFTLDSSLSISREIKEIFSTVKWNRRSIKSFLLLIPDSRIKNKENCSNRMWSSAKGPTRLWWDLLVITLVVTLSFKVSQLRCPFFFGYRQRRLKTEPTLCQDRQFESKLPTFLLEQFQYLLTYESENLTSHQAMLKESFT